MNKYRCYYKNDFNDDYDAMAEQDEHGDWYRVEDVDELVTDLRNEVELLNDAMESKQARLDEKDARIADLESGLRELLQDTQHVNHNCGDGPDLCPVARARELLGL